MRKKLKIKPEVIIGILLLFVISTLTVGYASYSRIITLNASSTFKHNGTVRITQFEVVDESNLDTHSETINGMSVTFAADFENVGNNATYYVVYEITITNDSFYAYDFADCSYTPDITSQSSTVHTAFSVSGINEGETIPGHSTKTFRVRIDVTLDANHSGDINVGGDINNEVEQEYIGSLIGSITGSTSGDLINNNLAQFTVSVANTYEYNKTFNFELGNSNNFSIVDCSTGNSLADMTIARNTTDTYTFCVKRNAGVTFVTSPQPVSVYLTCPNLSNYSMGNLSLDVTVEQQNNDHEPPEISNLTATKKTGSPGTVTVSWNGSDEHTITKYHLRVYKNGTMDGQEIVITTSNTSYSYEVTNISADTNYYFVVYGEDDIPNIPDSNAISSPVTGTGYVVKTNPVAQYSWTHSVTLSTDRYLNSQGNSTATEGTDYTATFSVQTLYLATRGLPDTITVTIGSVTKSACQNINSCTDGYYWNQRSGQVTIPGSAITGNIQITVNSDGCLIKGTKVLLANGKYKNIEDVDYTDLLAVWDYKNGGITYEYPIWIEQEKKASSYQKTTFSDGTILKTFGAHAIYDLDKNMFVDISNSEEVKVGSRIAKIVDGKIVPVTVKKIEKINKPTTYYHVVSTTYYNIIANDLLTTDDATILSNLYGFTDKITWPKMRDSIINNKLNLYKYEELNNSLPYYMFKGLRAEEAKYLINEGYMTDEMLQYYFIQNQSNPDMVREPITKKGERYWPVSIGDKKY